MRRLGGALAVAVAVMLAAPDFRSVAWSPLPWVRQVTSPEFPQAGGGDRTDARPILPGGCLPCRCRPAGLDPLAERCRRSRVRAWFPNGEAGLGRCAGEACAGLDRRLCPSVELQRPSRHARSSPRTRPTPASRTADRGGARTRSCASGRTIRTSLARSSSDGTPSPLPPRSPSSRVRSPIPVRPHLQQPVGHPPRRRGSLRRVHRVVDAPPVEPSNQP